MCAIEIDMICASRRYGLQAWPAPHKVDMVCTSEDMVCTSEDMVCTSEDMVCS